MSPVVLDALALVGGLVLMTVAADRFVLGAARLSTALRLSPVIIGAIVIGFGTSAPEFVVTILATLQGSQDLAFGNVVGSNVANVFLVIGAAALFAPLAVSTPTLRRELPLSTFSVLLLAVLLIDLRIGALDATLLLAVGLASIGWIVWTGLRDRAATELMAREVAEYQGSAVRMGPTVLLVVAGLAGTVAGAHFLVEGARGLAEAFGLSEAVIGIAIVAPGTSLPELVTAVVAAWRRESELVVGNILGSNLFNAALVAGVAGSLDTVDLDPAFRVSSAIMVFAVLLLAVFMRSGHRVGRREGAVLLALSAPALYLIFGSG